MSESERGQRATENIVHLTPEQGVMVSGKVVAFGHRVDSKDPWVQLTSPEFPGKVVEINDVAFRTRDLSSYIQARPLVEAQQGAVWSISEARTKKSAVEASQVVETYAKEIIPNLLKRRDEALKVLKTLGAKVERLDKERGLVFTPEVLDRAKAISRAQRQIGGERVERLEASVKNLDKLDAQYDKRISDIELRLEAAKTSRVNYFTGIVFRLQQQRKKIYAEAVKLRDDYNEAAVKYNAAIEHLRSPEMRSKIEQRAEIVLAQNRENSVRVDKMYDAFKLLSVNITEAYHTRYEFGLLKGQRIDVYQGQNQVVPANRREFDRRVERARGQSLSVEHEKKSGVSLNWSVGGR